MALISGGILVLMWILGHDFSGHYNRLALISVDIISGVYCIISDPSKLGFRAYKRLSLLTDVYRSHTHRVKDEFLG